MSAPEGPKPELQWCSIKLNNGATVTMWARAGGEGYFLTFTSPDGNETPLALSDEALGAVVRLKFELDGLT